MTTFDADLSMRHMAERLETQERELEELRSELRAWREQVAKLPMREDVDFTSVSGRNVEPVYTALDLDPHSVSSTTLPGDYPYTRGIHPTMYRGRLWTMRQFAGFGTAEDTNERYKFLLAHGQTGLSVAFDFPTLMGYDSDHPRSEGEVGKCGVAISSAQDMETLFDGIPLDKVSTSMTINGPAAMLYCFYVAAAEHQGVDIAKLQGTIQNDMLKEYMAQHAWIFPVEPALKVIVDMFDFASTNTPNWNTISSRATISGKPAPPRHRSWRSRSPTASPTSSGGSRAGSTSTVSPHGCRSSGTSTTTSSRRSRSCAPRAGSGRATCASATTRARRVRG